MINLSISIAVYFQLLNLFLYLAFNSMLPYIIIVSVLVVYSFDSLNIFKEHFILYWVKKLTTITNIYVFELALFGMHSKRLAFFKLQYNLIVLLNVLYLRLQQITVYALDSNYKKFVITRFFENLIWLNEEVTLDKEAESRDDYKESFEEGFGSENNQPDEDKDFEVSLREFKEREHKRMFECALARAINQHITTPSPLTDFNNIEQWIQACEIVDNLTIYYSRTDYEMETRTKQVNMKIAQFANSKGTVPMDHSDETMLEYILIMEIISLYRYAKKTDRRVDMFNSLKEINFDEIAIKAPYFYDLNTDTFLTNVTTRIFYKIRLDQAWEARQKETELKNNSTDDSMSDEEWEEAVLNEIASEVEERSASYWAFKDTNATIR